MNVNDINDWSLNHQLMVVIKYAALATLVSGAWVLFCRWWLRDEERQYQLAVKALNAPVPVSLDEQIGLLVQQRILLGCGSPVDRLSIAGLVIAAIGVVLWLVFSLATSNF